MNSELPRERGLLSASPCMPISAQEIQSRQMRLNLACILPGYARTSAAQRPASSFVSPSPSQEGSSESERPHATYRALASATYPLRIRCDTAHCGGAGPVPPRRLTCDLPRCPRRAPARGGGTDAALLRGLTRPRASAYDTAAALTLCRLTCPHEPLPRPRRCGGPDTALRHIRRRRHDRASTPFNVSSASSPG